MAHNVQRSWLRHWHSVIDDALGKDPLFDFEAAVKDPYNDFRMHLLTWDLPDEDLARCFQVLPRGHEMYKRATEMRTLLHAKKSTISDNDALDLFSAGLTGFAQFVENDDLQKSIRVVRGKSRDLDSEMSQVDRVARLREDVHWSDHREPELIAVKSFVHETLYRLAHSYDVADYIEWPLLPDPELIDPYRSFALLAVSNRYYPALDADGPVLFVITDGVHN